MIQLDDDVQGFVSRGRFDHPYPTTRIMWIPDKQARHPDMIATTGDYLRLWDVTDSGMNLKALLNNVRCYCCSFDPMLICIQNKNSDFCAPLTSFDWNESDPNLLGTSSIDTTCTIWNLETQQVRSQLIAHDKEVYDIAFQKGTDIFASVGADGSLRLFDLRYVLCCCFP